MIVDATGLPRPGVLVRGDDLHADGIQQRRLGLGQESPLWRLPAEQTRFSIAGAAAPTAAPAAATAATWSTFRRLVVGPGSGGVLGSLIASMLPQSQISTQAGIMSIQQEQPGYKNFRATSGSRPRRAGHHVFMVAGGADWQLQRAPCRPFHFGLRRPALCAGRRRPKCDPLVGDRRRVVVNPAFRWGKPSGGGNRYLLPAPCLHHSTDSRNFRLLGICCRTEGDSSSIK